MPSPSQLLPGILCLFLSFSALAQSASQTADSLYNAGKDWYYDGKYQEALVPFRAALRLYLEKEGPQSLSVLKAYQRIGDAFRGQRRNEQALENYQKSLQVAAHLDSFPLWEKAEILNRMGHTYGHMYLPEKANAFYFQSLEIYKEVFGECSSEVGNAYMNIGISQMQMSFYYDALHHFQKAFDIFSEASEPNSVDFNRIYSNMGYLYRKMGDYDRSIQFAEKALEIKLKNYPQDHPSVPKYYRNIGRAWQGKGEYARALPYFERTVAAQEKAIGPGHPGTGGAYGELANILADLERYDEALNWYQKANFVLERSLSSTHPYLVAGYFNMGRVYEDMGDLAKALDYYHQVLSKFVQSPEPPHELIAQTQGQIASVYLRLDKPDQAINSVQAALEQLIIPPGRKLASDYENPELEEIQADLCFLDLLRIKSDALYKRGVANDQLADLEVALSTNSLSIELAGRLRRNYPSRDSRQELNETLAVIYQSGVEQAFTLFQTTGNEDYLEQALEVSSRSKSGLLWQHLNQDQARQIAGLSRAEITQLQKLQSQLQESREAYSARPGEEQKRRRREAEIAYLQAEEALAKKYPDYRKLQFVEAPLSLQELSGKLSTESALAEYFYTDQDLYIFLVTSKGLEGWKQPIYERFEEDILSLHQSEFARLMGEAQSMTSYMQALNRLHTQLVAPLRAALRGYRELILIPHEQLNYLSFELLAPESSGADFKNLDYLLRHFNIQYAWSSRLWYEASAAHEATAFASNFLGFSPAFPEQELAGNFRAGLSPLRYNNEEVKSANALMKGEVFIGSKATKASFRRLGSSARVLHLATHGLADDQQPLQSGLFFTSSGEEEESGFLSALEIYGLDLPAELAVVSACNTAYGKLASGEGVMSLGRAFAYAGCKSVLMSLWSANDRSTARIMASFYQYLSAGKAKHEALRLAKLRYLEEADPLKAHPYFWAGIIAKGDMAPLHKKSLASWIWLAAGLLALGLGYYFRSATGQ